MNKLRMLGCLLACVTGLSAPTSWAEWSMNAGVTSDYVYRGLSQTSGGPAVSGGFDYEHDNGFFFGGWVSNVDFGGSLDFDGVSLFNFRDPSMEVDLYAGYAGESGQDGIFGYAITYFQYLYPFRNLRGSNYGDLIFDFYVSDFVFGVGYTTDAEINKGADGAGTFNETGDLYLYFGYSAEYESGWSFASTLNFHTFATDDDERANLGNPSFYWYMDLGVAKSTDYGQVKLSLTKIFNYVAEPGADYGYELSYRPVISWTSYF